MKLISRIAVAVISLIALAGQTSKAPAVTAKVAKACARSLAKAFPPVEPGNPAAGSAAGGVEDQRQFYAKCVANGGAIKDADTKSRKIDQISPPLGFFLDRRRKLCARMLAL